MWIAAPLTGLLVQPIVGHLSDRTWLGRLGRRRPYFLAGALLATLSLLLMPLSTQLIMAAVLLWTLDASLNISMEPFRAFVGDMLRKDQHAAGYAVQTAFIGAGAVVGSEFPRLLDALGVSNSVAGGGIPDTVRYSFWAGAVALFLAVLWTVSARRANILRKIWRSSARRVTTRRMMKSSIASLARAMRQVVLWIAGGVIVVGLVRAFAFEKEMYLLGALLIAYGVARMVAVGLARAGKSSNMLASIVGDFSGMPRLMKRLALVQFFSWSALFIMWVFTTPVVAQRFYGTTDQASPVFQDAGNKVGELFAIYNGVAAIAALTLLPWLSARIGKSRTHIVCLLCGAAAFASFFVVRDRAWLTLSEVGIGIAWASILAMPYAILASALPQRKLGIYMGLFNVFVVLPQLLVATVMGTIMKALFPDQPIWTMLAAALVMAAAALAMLRVAAIEREGEAAR